MVVLLAAFATATDFETSLKSETGTDETTKAVRKELSDLFTSAKEKYGEKDQAVELASKDALDTYCADEIKAYEVAHPGRLSETGGERTKRKADTKAAAAEMTPAEKKAKKQAKGDKKAKERAAAGKGIKIKTKEKKTAEQKLDKEAKKTERKAEDPSLRTKRKLEKMHEKVASEKLTKKSVCKRYIKLLKSIANEKSNPVPNPE